MPSSSDPRRAGCRRSTRSPHSRHRSKADLEAGDLALAHDHGRVLVARSGRAIVIDLATGRASDAGVDIGAETLGARASGLPTSGFVLSTSTATYRID